MEALEREKERAVGRLVIVDNVSLEDIIGHEKIHDFSIQ